MRNAAPAGVYGCAIRPALVIECAAILYSVGGGVRLDLVRSRSSKKRTTEAHLNVCGPEPTTTSLSTCFELLIGSLVRDLQMWNAVKASAPTSYVVGLTGFHF